MTKREFRRALRLGLGRAILYARHHPIDRFYNEILDACLSDDVYDHIEDGREPYLLELTDLHPQRKRIYSQVVAALPSNGKVWSLVVELAKRKHPKAKQALYANFNPTPDAGAYEAIDLVAADGLAGFRKAVQKLGAIEPCEDELCRTRFFISEANDLLGAAVVATELKRLGKFGSAIEARLRRERTSSPPSPELPETYREFLPLLPATSDWRCGQWGLQATTKELRRAAKGLLAAETLAMQLAHLRIFSRVRFPLPVPQLMRLLPIRDKRRKLAILRVLSQCKHPSLRQYALELLASQGPGRRFSIEMLLRNGRKGDLSIAVRAFESVRSSFQKHHFGSDILDHCESKPHSPGSAEALLSVYEHSPCTMCRRKTVKILLEKSALPEDLRAECAYDCNPYIRKLVTPT